MEGCDEGGAGTICGDHKQPAFSTEDELAASRR